MSIHGVYPLKSQFCRGHWNLLIFCHFDENLQFATGSRCMLLLDSLEMTGPRRLEPDIRKCALFNYIYLFWSDIFALSEYLQFTSFYLHFRFVQDIYKVGDMPETEDLISRIPLLVPKVITIPFTILMSNVIKSPMVKRKPIYIAGATTKRRHWLWELCPLFH